MHYPIKILITKVLQCSQKKAKVTNEANRYDKVIFVVSLAKHLLMKKIRETL